MKNLSSFVYGVILLIIGVILGLNILEITDINIFFEGWWTLLFLVPKSIKILKREARTIDFIIFVVFALILTSYYTDLDFDVVLDLMIPIILIICGISLIFKKIFSNDTEEEIKKINKKKENNLNEYFSTFSSQKLDFSDEEFNGCEVSAVFGGIQIDLSNAIIKENVVLNASSIFGGVDIILPKEVNVKIKSNSIFGGVDNKYKKKNKSNITIYINAACLFGGVEIK